jgi:TonB family protein
MLSAPPPDVYSASDIAAAAGVSEARVRALMARGQIRSIGSMTGSFDPGLAGFVSTRDAARAVRALATGSALALSADALGLGRELFSEGRYGGRPTAVPLIVSTSLHVVAIAAVLFVASLGFAVADERTEPLKDPEPMRLVFLAVPGPGGGGGGGGLKMKAPPPKAERKGIHKISSPLPARKLPPPMEPPKRPAPPPPPLDAKVLPPVMAPIVEKPADKRDVEGVLAKAPDVPPSQGPGVGGSVGSGKGTGIGQGDGPGVGEGSGGGTGGGPYRPGSGVEPPRLLREVRADYSDEARRANITGEVVLEIIVRANGTVGDVKVMRGLPMGLNDRAIEAVRQWRFAPARMKGTPVDVVVEVGVEFKLR